MSDFTDLCRDALAEATTQLGSNIIYKGSTYKAIVNDAQLSSELGEGGWTHNVVTTVVIQKHLLTVPPKAGERLTVEGRQVRIETVSQDEVSYTLQAVTAVK